MLVLLLTTFGLQTIFCFLFFRKTEWGRKQTTGYQRDSRYRIKVWHYSFLRLWVGDLTSFPCVHRWTCCPSFLLIYCTSSLDSNLFSGSIVCWRWGKVFIHLTYPKTPWTLLTLLYLFPRGRYLLWVQRSAGEHLGKSLHLEVSCTGGAQTFWDKRRKAKNVCEPLVYRTGEVLP